MLLLAASLASSRAITIASLGDVDVVGYLLGECPSSLQYSMSKLLVIRDEVLQLILESYK